jgi:hypothetical protein
MYRRRRATGGADAKLFKIISNLDAPALRKALRRRRVTEDRVGDFTLLQWCSTVQSSGELATILIEADAEVDSRRASNGASPLHVSTYPPPTHQPPPPTHQPPTVPTPPDASFHQLPPASTTTANTTRPTTPDRGPLG